jgi:hypothetical protein
MPLLSCHPFPFPAQPTFLPRPRSQQEVKCQTAGALTLHEQTRPELCLHTSIVSYRMSDCRCYSPFHPQAVQGITYDSRSRAWFTDGCPIQRRYSSKREKPSTHAPASYPPSQQNLHHPMLPLLSASIKTWFIIISPLHVAMSSSQFSGISERARQRWSVDFAFHNPSFDGLRESGEGICFC